MSECEKWDLVAEAEFFWLCLLCDYCSYVKCQKLNLIYSVKNAVFDIISSQQTLAAGISSVGLKALVSVLFSYHPNKHQIYMR